MPSNPPKETPKGKATSKSSKTGKVYFLERNPVEVPTAVVVMDEAGEDVNRYPLDLSTPLPLQCHPGHLTVAADYFFNNDLEYLKSPDPERTYTTSITKTKGERRKLWQDSQLNKFSKLMYIPHLMGKFWGSAVVSVKKLVTKYGHLDEIVVKRADRQSLVIKKHVEDLQLGVESYQKKLNITLPQQTFHKRVTGADGAIQDLERSSRKFGMKLLIEYAIFQFGIQYGDYKVGGSGRLLTENGQVLW
ncbi:hypothetical protein Tco_0504990 [Tanacetum coccineum]|uniref:Uncharacterized protein n=1 Tax=Tanacetum coccineum TaxID=301880 RepID=A0ABQ5F3B7_9ASTR